MTNDHPCWTCVLRYAEYYLDWTDPKDVLECAGDHLMWQSECKYYVDWGVAQDEPEDFRKDDQ